MQILISAEQIRDRVWELARKISQDYELQPVTIIGVLTGSLMFLADLVRQLTVPSRIGFVQASSYRGETTTPGNLQIAPDVLPDVRDRNVLILDDILDSGHTMTNVVRLIRADQPRSLKTAVLLRKRGRQQVPLEPDYCGFEIPDVFVVGYGLDYNDEYRQLPYIATLETEKPRNANA